MKNLTGIISTALLIGSLAAPAWAELSETAAAGEQTPGHPLSAPGNGGGQAGINFLLDRFAGTGLSDPSSKEGYKPSNAIVPPMSETTLYSAFTRSDSPMNAYYSRLGTDNSGTITAISRSVDYVATAMGGNIVLPESGLAGVVWGYFVGSGVVVGGASVAPMQIFSSSPSVIQNYIGPACINPSPKGVPLPFPFLFTGSGLVTLLALRKTAGNKG